MNDDDTDFKPSHSTSSNLTSLFDTNRPRPSDNQTLTYTAPKPPKAGESSSTPVRGSSAKSLGTEKLEIIISKTIQLYKLENEKYIGQGAAGIAIIGHHDLHIYQIILYKNNREYLSKTYLQPNFIFTVLENNYASFYDNARQNWSILFPSTPDVQHFAKQVAIAKYNSQSKKEKIIMQELIQPGSIKANEKDIVNLEYSCSLLNNDEIIPFKEKSNWSVEIADDYTFPWQAGLKDCRNKCKRIIIIPYRLSAPWTNEIQQNSSVIVEFEVESVISSKRLDQNKTVEAKTQDDSTTDSSAEEDNCRVKPISLKESITLSDPQKADLISRIAKMGQALPLKVSLACGSNNTSDENSLSSKQMNDQATSSNFHSYSPQQIDDQQQYMLSTNSNRTREIDVRPWQHQQITGGLNFAYQELYPIMSGPPGFPAQNYHRGRETTGTDAELRLTINKVSQKVDHLLNKLQNFDATNWDRVKAHQSATILDPVNVINSIQDVMAENESLRVEIQQQKSKINEQGNKLHSLMELTQRCVERCSYPTPVVTLSGDKIIGLEERPNISNQLMTEANTRMNQLTIEIEKYKREISENEQQIKQCQIEIQNLVEKFKDKDKIIQNMEAELIQTTTEKERLITVNEQQKKDIQQFKQQESIEKKAELQSASSEELVEEIKKVMNAVNRKFQSYFDSDQFYSGKEIKAAIATTLKEVTMEYLRYRTMQKTTSRLDTGQKEMSRTENRGITHSQLASESNDDALEGENLRNQKLRIVKNTGTGIFQRIVPADKEFFQSSESIRDKQVEELEKSSSRLIKESSISVTSQTRSNEEICKLSESSSVTQNMKSVKTVRGESQELNANEPITTSSRSFLNSTKTSVMQTFPNVSASVASHFSSEGDESLKRDIPIMTNEQESFLEDDKPDNIEIDKRNFMRSILTRTEHSETAEKLIKNSNRRGSETISGEESFVFVPGEKPDASLDGVSKLGQKSEIHSASDKSTSLGRVTLTEDDESMRRQNDVISNKESFVVIAGEKVNAPLSRTSSQAGVHQESDMKSASVGFTAMSKESPSQLDAAFARVNVFNSLETETIQNCESSLNMSEENARKDSTNAIENIRHASLTTEGQIRDIGESVIKMGLNKIESSETDVKVENIMSNKIEKSSVLLKKTLENVEDVSNKTNPEKPTTYIDNSKYESSSLLDFDKEKSQAKNIDKNNKMMDIRSVKEEIGYSNEKEDEIMSPSSSDEKENVKYFGSNTVNDSSLYSDYFQGWESSKPPPLPLEDEEGSSEPDEEWL